MSGETNQMPWDEAMQVMADKLLAPGEQWHSDYILPVEIACRKFAKQQNEELIKKVDQLTELSVAAMHIAEEPREFWENVKIDSPCPAICAVRRLRDDRDGLAKQYMELLDTADKLMKAYEEIRDMANTAVQIGKALREQNTQLKLKLNESSKETS